MNSRVVCGNVERSCRVTGARFVRSSFIGFWMGFKPGGATPASFMSYAFAKRLSPNSRSNFGKGEIEGVIAPETAAHAAGVAAHVADDHARAFPARPRPPSCSAG